MWHLVGMPCCWYSWFCNDWHLLRTDFNVNVPKPIWCIPSHKQQRIKVIPNNSFSMRIKRKCWSCKIRPYSVFNYLLRHIRTFDPASLCARLLLTDISPASCGNCHLLDPKVRCNRKTLGIDDEPIYLPGDLNRMFERWAYVLFVSSQIGALFRHLIPLLIDILSVLTLNSFNRATHLFVNFMNLSFLSIYHLLIPLIYRTIFCSVLLSLIFYSSIVSKFGEKYEVKVESKKPWVVTFDNFLSGRWEK